MSLECIALIAVAVLRIQSAIKKEKGPYGKGNQPILLVHGYLNGGYVWRYLRKWLVKKGFGPIYTIDLGHPFQSIRDYADKIRMTAELIREETGVFQLVLIGHSMGGLVSAYYATKVAPQNSIAQVIAIASPLQGTKMARFGVGGACREMQKDSNVIGDLSLSLSQQRGLYYHIATKTDQLILPYTSSLYASDPKRRFVFSNIGHASLLFSRRVAQLLEQWLLEGNSPP